MELDLEDINKRLDEFEKEHKPFRQFQPIGDDDFVVEFPKGPTTQYRCTPKTKLKYSLFIGRWQNWHKGHEWLIDQQLKNGKNVWVAIRDVPMDENNPKTSHKVWLDLLDEPFFIKNKDRILVSIIPDIESVNYGRGVGYDVIYHEPPAEIGNISGTKIRKNLIDKL
jgi:hypothetical protein